MTPEVRAVVDQIKAVLREANNIRTVTREVPRVKSRWADKEGSSRQYTEKSDEDISRANTLMLSALAKFSPPRLPYVAQAQKIVDHSGLNNDWTREQLIGIL